MIIKNGYKGMHVNYDMRIFYFDRLLIRKILIMILIVGFKDMHDLFNFQLTY